MGLIPARAGSERIPNKNILPISGHPLIAYSISTAIKSEVFEDVIVVTDDANYAKVAQKYGASVPKLRPKSLSGSKSPDIDWVLWAISEFKLKDICDCFAILRPTNPLRTEVEIKEAWKSFQSNLNADSLRAVSPVKEHPGKMWRKSGGYIVPILPYSNGDVPWHSSQKPMLPEVFVQNASLEIAKISVVLETQTIAGHTIIPYFSKQNSGFDINDPSDVILLNAMISTGQVKMPKLD